MLATEKVQLLFSIFFQTRGTNIGYEEEQRWWQKIKDQSGLRSDTECLRQLIFHKYQELMANESSPS
ncbi:MAG: hypothetical protein ACFFC7_06800 [Candidatus Hermodarchaeota archaeon]